MQVMDDLIELIASRPELEACYYGAVPGNITKTLNRYNYAACQRNKKIVSGPSSKERIRVAIVFENRIPDTFVVDLIKDARQLGFRLDDESGVEYEYTTIRDTALTLELAVFHLYTTPARWC